MSSNVWIILVTVVVMTGDPHVITSKGRSVNTKGTSSAHTTQELNSVTLVLDVTLDQYNANDLIKNTLYKLIVNVTTVDCTKPKQKCKLIATKNRNSGPYKREITADDYIFSTDMISVLKLEEDDTFMTKNGNGKATKLVFSMTTDSGLDYLKWTEIVRVVYAQTSFINQEFTAETNMTDVSIILADPVSYIAGVIKGDIASQLIAAGVILGVALIVFAVLVPLSNTRFCRKDLKVGVEKDIEDAEFEKEK